MFVNQIDESIHIFFLLEDRTGCHSTAAAFPAVNGSILFHKSAAVRFSVGTEKNRVTRTMYQKEHRRNCTLQLFRQIQQVVHRENIIIERRIPRTAARCGSGGSAGGKTGTDLLGFLSDDITTQLPQLLPDFGGLFLLCQLLFHQIFGTGRKTAS